MKLRVSATQYSEGGDSEGENIPNFMEIEELYVYTLAFIESLTLKEYVKSKIKDLM